MQYTSDTVNKGFLLCFKMNSMRNYFFLQTLPAGCRLEVITVQEEVEETKVIIC